MHFEVGKRFGDFISKPAQRFVLLFDSAENKKVNKYLTFDTNFRFDDMPK
jgi:hypothetical protein